MAATITIVGGSGTTQTVPFPIKFAAPIIERMADWGGQWKLIPTLQLVSCGVRASSTEADSMEVIRRYGTGTNHVKQPYDQGFSELAPLDFTNQWLRMSFQGTNGKQIQFVGQIMPQSRNVAGTDNNPAGTQNLIAYGGLAILHKLTISQSVFFKDDGTTAKVDWIPAMNSKDKKGMLVGNQTFNDADYAYGGDDVWTHLEYCNYLLKNFINQGAGAPVWTIGGQTDILQKMETTIEFEQASSAAKMLQQLIPVKYGVDFHITPTTAGFEITVFALTDKASNVAGASVPANPNIITIDRDKQLNLVDVHTVESTERKVDRIQVIGKRIVVCGTLKPIPPTSPGDMGKFTPRTLLAKWAPALEADYISAGGTTGNAALSEKTWDATRKREKYRGVYQLFGAPTDWDLDGGTWSVACKDDGTAAGGASLTTGDFQTSIRETQGFIPLKEGFDYTQNPPADNTLANSEPDYKPPLAWIYDEQSLTRDDDVAGYIQCDLNGMHVSRPFQEWGVFLHASPNHAIALNHWTDAQIATTDEPKDGLSYDYNTLVATIAIESDHRLQLGYDVPANLAAGDGSVKTIMEHGAELWVMLPKTIVDVDVKGVLQDSGGAMRILRDDTSRIALLLAGEYSRYVYERSRMQLTFEGHMPWANLVGSVIHVFQAGIDLMKVGLPITYVEWVLEPKPITIVRTGYM